MDTLLPDVGGTNVMNILAISEDKWIAGSKLAEDHPSRWEVEVDQGRGGWGITGGGCYMRSKMYDLKRVEAGVKMGQTVILHG